MGKKWVGDRKGKEGTIWFQQNSCDLTDFGGLGVVGGCLEFGIEGFSCVVFALGLMDETVDLQRPDPKLILPCEPLDALAPNFM